MWIIFLAVLDASQEDRWFEALRELISHLQERRVWMSESRPPDMLDDDFLFPMMSASSCSGSGRTSNYMADSDVDSVRGDMSDLGGTKSPMNHQHQHYDKLATTTSDNVGQQQPSSPGPFAHQSRPGTTSQSSYDKVQASYNVHIKQRTPTPNTGPPEASETPVAMARQLPNSDTQLVHELGTAPPSSATNATIPAMPSIVHRAEKSQQQLVTPTGSPRRHPPESPSKPKHPQSDGKIITNRAGEPYSPEPDMRPRALSSSRTLDEFQHPLRSLDLGTSAYGMLFGDPHPGVIRPISSYHDSSVHPATSPDKQQRLSDVGHYDREISKYTEQMSRSGFAQGVPLPPHTDTVAAADAPGGPSSPVRNNVQRHKAAVVKPLPPPRVGNAAPSLSYADDPNPEQRLSSSFGSKVPPQPTGITFRTGIVAAAGADRPSSCVQFCENVFDYSDFETARRRSTFNNTTNAATNGVPTFATTTKSENGRTAEVELRNASLETSASGPQTTLFSNGTKVGTDRTGHRSPTTTFVSTSPSPRMVQSTSCTAAAAEQNSNSSGNSQTQQAPLLDLPQSQILRSDSTGSTISACLVPSQTNRTRPQTTILRHHSDSVPSPTPFQPHQHINDPNVPKPYRPMRRAPTGKAPPIPKKPCVPKIPPPPIPQAPRCAQPPTHHQLPPMRTMPSQQCYQVNHQRFATPAGPEPTSLPHAAAAPPRSAPATSVHRGTAFPFPPVGGGGRGSSQGFYDIKPPEPGNLSPTAAPVVQTPDFGTKSNRRPHTAGFQTEGSLFSKTIDTIYSNLPFRPRSRSKNINLAYKSTPKTESENSMIPSPPSSMEPVRRAKPIIPKTSPYSEVTIPATSMVPQTPPPYETYQSRRGAYNRNVSEPGYYDVKQILAEQSEDYHLLAAPPTVTSRYSAGSATNTALPTTYTPNIRPLQPPPISPKPQHYTPKPNTGAGLPPYNGPHHRVPPATMNNHHQHNRPPPLQTIPSNVPTTQFGPAEPTYDNAATTSDTDALRNYVTLASTSDTHTTDSANLGFRGDKNNNTQHVDFYNAQSGPTNQMTKQFSDPNVPTTNGNNNNNNNYYDNTRFSDDGTRVSGSPAQVKSGAANNVTLPQRQPQPPPPPAPTITSPSAPNSKSTMVFVNDSTTNSVHTTNSGGATRRVPIKHDISTDNGNFDGSANNDPVITSLSTSYPSATSSSGHQYGGGSMSVASNSTPARIPVPPPSSTPPRQKPIQNIIFNSSSPNQPSRRSVTAATSAAAGRVTSTDTAPSSVRIKAAMSDEEAPRSNRVNGHPSNRTTLPQNGTLSALDEKVGKINSDNIPFADDNAATEPDRNAGVTVLKLNDPRHIVPSQSAKDASKYLPNGIAKAPVLNGTEPSTDDMADSNTVVVAEVHGTIGPSGEHLESAETGVSIHVPPGALDSTKELYFKVCRDANMAPPLDALKGERLLSPLVMCGPQGLKFDKPVELRLPHSASGLNSQQWNLALKSTTQDSSGNTEWKNVDLTSLENNNNNNYSTTNPFGASTTNKDSHSGKLSDRFVSISIDHF